MQHREFIQYFHKTHEEFERLKEHDKRKRIYALEHNIELLDIWYYNEDNIEYILKNYAVLHSDTAELLFSIKEANFYKSSLEVLMLVK